MFVTPDVTRAEVITPASAAKTPDKMYTDAIILLMLIPETRAAFALPPTANTYLPYLVLYKSKKQIARIIANIIIGTGSTPPNIPPPIYLNSAVSFGMGFASVKR